MACVNGISPEFEVLLNITTFKLDKIVILYCVLVAASAIFGGSLMGIAGRFSPKYITAMSSGQALGGIITATAEICSLWIGASPVLSGLVYFIIGDVILFLSLIAYIILEKAVSSLAFYNDIYHTGVL